MSKLRFTDMLRMLVAEISPSSDAHYSREFDYIISNNLNIIDTAFSAMNARVTTVEETLTEHDTRLATLETWKTSVDSELEQHSNRLAVIENVISTVSTQNVEDLMERVTALESKVTTNASQISELNLNITDINSRLAADEVAINTNKGNIEGAISRIVILENCCSEVRETLSAYDIRITKNTDDISDILIRLTRDENNIQGNAEDISALSVQVQTNASNIEDLTEALNELDPTSTIGLVRQVATNTENISNLQSVTASHTSTLDSMVVRFTNDEVRITDLERRMTDAEDALSQVQDWQNEIDSLSATVDDMVNTQFPALTNTVNGFESRIATLEGCCEDMQEYVTSNDARVLAVEARVTTAEGNITTLTSRVTAVENGVSALDTDLTTVEGNVESLVSRVTALETSVGSDDISSWGESVTAAILMLGGRIGSVNTNLMGLFARVSTLERTVGTHSTNISDLDTRVDTLESTITDKADTSYVDAQDDAIEATIGDLSELETTDKSSIVDAINEVVENTALSVIQNALHPVGSVYITMTNVNPSTLLGFGTWSLLSDGYLRNNAPSASGGSMTSGSHILTVNEMPSHNHGGVTGYMSANSTGEAAFDTYGVGSPLYAASGNMSVASESEAIQATGTVASPRDTYYYLQLDVEHNHSIISEGGDEGHTHSIEPTYTRVYAWERTA